jgi:alpha-galactosidase
MKADPMTYSPESRGEEHGSYIIESLETGRVYRGHFNVVNKGVITNLPDDCIIEAPGYVDRNGISMPVVGDLPIGCAAVCSASVWVQRLAVEASMRKDVQLLKQAFMMDPLTGAVCNPKEISQMVDEMLVAGKSWLPQWKEEIALARVRLETEPRVPTRESKGAARLKTKSVEEMAVDKELARKNASEADKAKERPVAK